MMNMPALRTQRLMLRKIPKRPVRLAGLILLGPPKGAKAPRRNRWHPVCHRSVKDIKSIRMTRIEP